MSRKSLEKTFELGKMTFLPAKTGTTRRQKLEVAMRYVGETADQVFDFLASAGSDAVTVTIRLEAGEEPMLETFRAALGKSSLTPKRGGERQEVHIPLVVLGEELATIREVIKVVLDLANGELGHAHLTLRIAEPMLDFDGEGEGE